MWVFKTKKRAEDEGLNGQQITSNWNKKTISFPKAAFAINRMRIRNWFSSFEIVFIWQTLRSLLEFKYAERKTINNLFIRKSISHLTFAFFPPPPPLHSSVWSKILIFSCRKNFHSRAFSIFSLFKPNLASIVYARCRGCTWKIMKCEKRRRIFLCVYFESENYFSSVFCFSEKCNKNFIGFRGERKKKIFERVLL